MKSESHRWATVNYIHHNPVHHGYAAKWHEWPYSSAVSFLNQTGEQEAARLWHTYPVLAYGKGWDDPEM